MKDFELLKRTYPISEFNRVCDGYVFILYNTTPEERKKWKIDRDEGINLSGFKSRYALNGKV